MATKEFALDRQAESMAVCTAIMTGECDKCPCLAECSTNDDFQFPADAFCMKRKEDILKGWAEDGN